MKYEIKHIENSQSSLRAGIHGRSRLSEYCTGRSLDAGINLMETKTI